MPRLFYDQMTSTNANPGRCPAKLPRELRDRINPVKTSLLPVGLFYELVMISLLDTLYQKIPYDLNL